MLIPNLIHKSVKTIHSLINNTEDNVLNNNDYDVSKWYQYRNELSDNGLKQKIRVKTKRYIYKRSTT